MLRILVGNHIDPAIRDRGDLRAWTQRLLWFARDGDVAILCDQPDPAFVAYVTSLTGVDHATLRVVVPPPGRHGGGLLEPRSLTDSAFLQAVRAACAGAGSTGVQEVFALWPSAAVARFAAALGCSDRLPGAAFIAQGGGELANNKAVFRALAASAGVSMPDGAVVRSREEALDASMELLERSRAVVVKQAHNGAGVGNQLVVADPGLRMDSVGARHLHRLDSTSLEAITVYWARRWNWASAGGRFPVVIEEFIPHIASVYSEHYAADDRCWPTEMGTLHYVGRRLSHQSVPLRWADESICDQLLRGGTLLAETYRGFGYRGHLSADAVLTPDHRVLFTEVNAQVSGSLHIYQEIAHRIVRVTSAPQRSVVEYHVPPTWCVPDFATFLAAVHELGCAYDPATRTGVIVSMPAIPLQPGRAQFVFCLAYGSDHDRQDVWDALDQRFAAVPADAYDPSDHIGLAEQPTASHPR